MKPTIRLSSFWLMLLVAVTACGQDVPQAQSAAASIDVATGVVVAVDGDLSEISSFSVVMSDGEILALTPEPGLLFDGDEPLSHVRDHLVSGTPVEVGFYQDGENLICVAVGDAE